MIGIIYEYYVNGALHRVNGPARTWDDGDYMWCLNGKSHRYYGPQNLNTAWWIHHERIK
jgi:hypothetical protein